MLLMDFVLLGEISRSLMRDALAESKLNKTQAQICFLLSRNDVERDLHPMSPWEISQQLCMPASRVVSQLMGLLDERNPVVQKMPAESDNAIADLRRTFYVLTTIGRERVHALDKALREVDDLLVRTISRKAETTISQCALLLRGGLEIDAFNNPNTLRAALVSEQLSTKRNRTIPC